MTRTRNRRRFMAGFATGVGTVGGAHAFRKWRAPKAIPSKVSLGRRGLQAFSRTKFGSKALQRLIRSKLGSRMILKAI